MSNANNNCDNISIKNYQEQKESHMDINEMILL